MNFYESLKNYLSDSVIEKLKISLDKEPTHALLLNEKKMSKDDLLKEYPHLTPHPIVKNAFLYNKEEYDLGKSIWHELGVFYLQEPSAMLPAYFLSCNEHDLVLDMCAAPGGKSIQSSFLMNNNGLIISNDLSSTRNDATIQNIERLGIKNIIVTNGDFSNIYHKFYDKFDKIILDAPCSGSGMFRKQSEMIKDWTIEKVHKYSLVQKSLILMAYSMLKPGGELMYSTCSYSYEEDEEVIKHLLSNSDAEIVNIHPHSSFYIDKSNLGIHLFPFLFPGEGHYLCKIKKPGIYKPFFETTDKLSTKTFGDTIFGVTHIVDLPLLGIKRYGVKIATMKKDYKSYEFHYARVDEATASKIELSLDETKSYIYGNQIQKNNIPKGEVILTYKNIPFSFAKSDGTLIKNHYPKGLRKNIK